MMRKNEFQRAWDLFREMGGTLVLPKEYEERYFPPGFARIVYKGEVRILPALKFDPEKNQVNLEPMEKFDTLRQWEVFEAEKQANLILTKLMYTPFQMRSCLSCSIGAYCADYMDPFNANGLCALRD